MSKPIVLDNTSADPVHEFLESLHESSGTLTLLLIIGHDEIAEKGKEYVNFLLENAPEDYESVQFIFVSDHELIKQAVNDLEATALNFSRDKLEEYAVLAISPETNRIAAAVTASKLNEKPSRIKTAILFALGQ